MSVILFILNSGREVVGTLVSETFEEYVISQPHIIQPVQQGPDQYGLSLYPYSSADPEGKHSFNRNMIVSSSLKVPEDIEKNYLSQTSRIQIVSSLR